MRLHGADLAFFLGEDGRGEVLRATRAPPAAPLRRGAAAPRRSASRCEGFRERRDEALARGGPPRSPRPCGATGSPGDGAA